jgi:hypothetical protein
VVTRIGLLAEISVFHKKTIPFGIALGIHISVQERATKIRPTSTKKSGVILFINFKVSNINRGVGDARRKHVVVSVGVHILFFIIYPIFLCKIVFLIYFVFFILQKQNDIQLN